MAHKSKERLDAEANYQMTWRKRLDNFWFYYRWHLLGGTAAVLLLGLFISDMMGQVKPDYQLAIITDRYVSDEQRAAVEEVFAALVDDRNGDGKTAGTVVVYTLPLPGDDPIDPNLHMANVTRLSADLQTGESMIFLTDNATVYQSQYGCFGYNDGSLPVEGEEVRGADLGLPVGDTALLAQVAADTGLGDFSLVMRALYPELAARKPELALYHQQSQQLYDRLVG